MSRLLRFWQLWLSAALLIAGVIAYQATPIPGETCSWTTGDTR